MTRDVKDKTKEVLAPQEATIDEGDSDSVDASKGEQMVEGNVDSSRTCSADIKEGCSRNSSGDGYSAARTDDNAESSATGSDGGKGTGSGSGGGYSADCSSSSDASSGGAVPEDEMKSLKVIGVEYEENPKTRSTKSIKKSSQGKHNVSRSESKQEAASNGMDDSSTQFDGAFVVNTINTLPQWNGVRVQHPMDPRIDLSSVGHIQTSSLQLPYTDNLRSNEQSSTLESKQEATPSIDQYMSLMEVVRPFFHAYGINRPQLPGVEELHDHLSPELADESSGSNMKQTASLSGEPCAQLAGRTDSAGESDRKSTKEGSNEIDSSSMVVLARAKRKHLRQQAMEDAANEGSNNSLHAEPNASSTSSSDKRVQLKNPDVRVQDSEVQNELDSPENDSNENEAEIDAEMPDEEGTDRQESASASSSATRNNIQAEQRNLLGLGIPAVVSEYASSRAGSSGASNTKQLSTSGSGSSGNTGSGTASGSNQGGSSGSGNDQCGISSNGHGSSASGHDVKGSSEETMDNSGENNSGEGNSDATNSNNERKVNVNPTSTVEPSHVSAHRHHTNSGEASLRDPCSPVQSNIAARYADSNGVREKKLLDKKRKRMNMRREYEEKVEQEMDSSEGSRDRDENSLLKPGRPITLDKVLSFTKTPRIVVSAAPPFLVVHTNAAYCRLSGIDSHTVIGKPISTLLTIPDPQTLAAVNLHHQQPTAGETAAFPGVGQLLGNQGLHQDGNYDSFQSESREAQGLTAAEAAGRARAAASQEETVEWLIATNGFGRWNFVNLNAKPMFGQTLAIPKPSKGPEMRNREGGSNGSSITSNCEPPSQPPYRHVVCSMGVSPVVSSPEAFAVVTDKEQESHDHKFKRRKHHQNDPISTSSPHHPQQTRRSFQHREVSLHRKRHMITHYMIQLEPLDASSRKGSLESQSSTSTTLEAELLGMTKSELRLRRDSLRTSAQDPPQHEESDDDAVGSESSNPHEPVAAVG